MKLPWLNWGVFQYLKKHGTAESGPLCSLRFTWQKPSRLASSQETFYYDSLIQELYMARELAEAPMTSLKIYPVKNENALFALAEFANHIVAEIEMNEALPDSMPETYFIKANYEHGHLTNQPLAGHFNVEGAVWADQDGMQTPVVDWADPELTGSISSNLLKYAELSGNCPEENCNELISAVKKALGK